MGSRCEGCGQACLMDAAWAVRGLCPDCRKGLYGGTERHEKQKLFEPAPTQMAGQLALDDD